MNAVMLVNSCVVLVCLVQYAVLLSLIIVMQIVGAILAGVFHSKVIIY